MLTGNANEMICGEKNSLQAPLCGGYILAGMDNIMT